jgi:V/A-type H+-transporting ATPase subunit E
MRDPQAAPQASKGVETLISRLRDEGVAAGRREAERLVGEAETHARQILAKADASSKAQVTAAAEEAAALRRAGEEALRIAARDAVLELKEHLARRFADEVGKVVSDALRDEEMLKRLILAVAGRAPRSDPLAGFVQISERGPQYASLLELRDKFAIGYRPC